MIRVLYDEQGSYRDDLFVRIDARPSRVFIASSTWLGDFFSPFDQSSLLLNDEQYLTEGKNNIARLIKLWISLLTSDKPTCFLPVDLSDQSSNALQIIKAKKLYHIREVYTVDIVDGTSESRFFAKQPSINWKTSDTWQWEISPKAILTGLNWSLARLELPIVPLIYE